MKKTTALLSLALAILATLIGLCDSVSAQPAGLMAYWKFDEGSGITAADASGLGNTATLVNGFSWTTGITGSGVQLNGFSGYIRALSIAGGKGWQGDYTVSLWVKAGSVGQRQFKSVFNNSFFGGAGSFQIDVDGGNPGNYRLYAINGYSIAPVATQWQHIAVTLSGTTLKTYGNGTPTNTYTLAAGESNFFRDYVMGINRAGDSFFQGAIDEVQVYNRALSAAEIQALFSQSSGVADTIPPARLNGSPSGTLASGTTQTTLSLTTNESATCKYGTVSGTSYGSLPNIFSTTGGLSHSSNVSGLQNGQSYAFYVRCQDTSGNFNSDDFVISFSVAASSPPPPPSGDLIAYWKFDEGSGTTASDSSGNGNTGTLANGPVWTAGKVGGALSFDGVDDVVTVPKSFFGGNITVSAWLNQSTTSGTSSQATVIAEASSSGSRLFALLMDRDNKRICIGTTNTNDCTAINSYTSAGSWTHVTLTRPSNGIGTKIYLNGVDIAPNGLYSAEIITGGTIVGIGRYPTAISRSFGGSIDEFRIHNRILTAQEILALYNGGATPDLSVPVISNVTASLITTTTATITWTTDKLSDSQVEYGLTTSYNNASPINSSLVLNHSQALTGLTPNTTYNFRVKSKDASGNLAASQNFSFATANPSPPQDVTPPVISNVTVSSITATSVTITWTTDELSDSQVDYGLATTQLNSSLVLNHSQALTGLTPNTLYNFRVKSKDASGNLATSQSFSFTTTSSPPRPGKPNIILILADDLGWEGVGAYGQPLIPTPNIDNLANQGMLFSQAYADTICAPSRSALLTGQHPGHTRLRFNSLVDPTTGISVNDPGPLLLRDVTIAEVLKAADYKTALIGKWHTGAQESSGRPRFQGFDYFFGFLEQGDAGGQYYPTVQRENDTMVPVIGAPNTYIEDVYTEKSIDFITQNKDRPFFLHLTYHTPHNPYVIPPEGLGPYYGTKGWNLNQKGFGAMMTHMDADIGTIMATLSNLGIDQNTIVIFASDNGTELCCSDSIDVDTIYHTTGPLRGYKQSLYEGGIRIPLIARWPGVIPAGTRNDDIVALWDLLPTFAELANVAPSRGIDGISLVPTLLGTGKVSREYLYWESFASGGLQAVRMGDWKGVQKWGPPSFELYNLAVDLGETKNVANANPSIVNKITALMTTGRTVSTDGFPMPFVDSLLICRQRELLNGVDLLSYSGSSPSCAHLAAATVGENAYTDQTATISLLPANYTNKVLFRHANQDKNFQWSTFARLAVRQPSVVAVAYQAGATVPGWLQSWTPTGNVVTVNGLSQGSVNFTLYEKSFPQNATIFLGGNAQDGGSANNSYLVFIDTNSVTQTPTGLVAYWSFDGPAGPITNDSSGYEYHGILYNGATIGDGISNGPISVPGRIGGALSFDGVNDFVLAATGDTWKGDYTVTLWVKAAATSQPGEATLFANLRNFTGAGTLDSFQIDVDGSSPGNYRVNTAVPYTIAPVTTNWQFLTVTLNGTTLRTYNNGSLTNTYTIRVGESNFFRDYLLGINRRGNRYFQGMIDAVRVYNRALSAGEIQTLFAEGN